MVQIIAHIVQWHQMLKIKTCKQTTVITVYVLQCLASVTFRTPELNSCVPSQISHVYVLERRKATAHLHSKTDL